MGYQGLEKLNLLMSFLRHKDLLKYQKKGSKEPLNFNIFVGHQDIP